jgi:hypothetical protein
MIAMGSVSQCHMNLDVERVGHRRIALSQKVIDIAAADDSDKK